MSSKYKIAFCRFPGTGWEYKGCVSWLMRTMVKMKREEEREDGQIGGIAELTFTDTPIPMLRNRAIRKARLLGCQYVLMIDDDIVPDYQLGSDSLAVPFWDSAWRFMMDRRAEEDAARASFIADDASEAYIFEQFPPATIAAPYCGPPPDECVYVFHWKSFETVQPRSIDQPEPFALQMIEREDAARRSGIEQVAALPTGLILYDIRVFDVMERHKGLPWYAYEWEDKEYQTEKASTEDVYQTRNANLLGCPQFVNWNAWAIHHKSKDVLKPHVLSSDQIHQSLVHAARNNFKKGERVHFVRRSPDLDKKPAASSAEEG